MNGRAAVGTSQPAVPEALRSWLLGHFREQFGLEPAEVEGAELADLGLDSSELLGVIGALEDHLGRPVPETLFADHPTLDAVVDALSGGGRGPQAAGTPAPAGARALDTPKRHPFSEHVNPALGRRLEKLGLDKRFVRGEGARLVDARGRRYLDFTAAFGALPFGFNPPEMWRALEAVHARMEPSFVQPSALEAAGELARRLLALAPAPHRHVTFANSGAETVEVAIKLCRAATGRRAVLSTHGAFHGKTLAALAASGNTRNQAPFLEPGPDYERVPYGDAEALGRALERRPYAAFLVEPIQGEAGIVEPPPGYLARAQSLCRAAGVPFVVDEIQTGLGRAGAMLLSTEAGLEPDAITLAKALGGGLLPIGACLYGGSLQTEAFGLRHSSTFAANTLACRVGLAALDRLEADDGALVRRVAALGARMKDGLSALAGRHPELVRAVRGRGFMLGLELGITRDTWPSSFLGVAAEQELAAAAVCSYLLNAEGVRLAPTLNGSEVVRIEPPLTATWEECRELLDALERAFGVIGTRDSGRIFGAILDERPPASLPRPAARVPEIRHRRAPGDAPFAFVLHPLEPADFACFDPALASLDAPALAGVAGRLGGLVDPFVASEARIVSARGASAFGRFVIVGRTAPALAALPHDRALAEVREAVDLAAGAGAEIVGLGAYTSIATRGGLDFEDAPVPVTTGNAFTVVAGCDALSLALEALERPLDGAAVAVVGAAGSVGRASAILLAERAGRLVLVGNPARPAAAARARLLEVADEIGRHLSSLVREGRRPPPGSLREALASLPRLPPPGAPQAAFRPVSEALEARGRLCLTQSVEQALPSADVVLAATSAPRALVGPDVLRPGAVVCDLSRPRNVGSEVRDARPDVLVIDGGVVELPGRPRIGPFGLREGHAYACMAETMILALERRYTLASRGARLRIGDVLELRALADRHGFRVGGLSSFDRPLAAGDWARLRDRRRAAAGRGLRPSGAAPRPRDPTRPQNA